MKMFDMETNCYASEYVENNIGKLVNFAQRQGNIQESSAQDLVMDVWRSIRFKEQNGDAYDINKGKKTDIISVENYVLAMVKGYCKNKKYHYDYNEIPVSSLSGDKDDDRMSAEERAYQNAESSGLDEILAIEESLVDIKDEMDYVVNFTNKLNIKVVLKNIERIATKKININVLSELKSICKYNDEFATSFKRILEFRVKDREAFDRILDLV